MAEGCNVVWFELPATNSERARSFYADVFGWKFRPHESEADLRELWTIDTGAASIGGTLIISESEEVHPGGIVLYIQVEDLQHALERICDMGGVVVRDCARINPETGSYAQIRDTEGNILGIWSP